MTCDFGRKTCQWPWGKHVCASHAKVWMEGLHKALRANRPVQLLNGKWVFVRRARPNLRVVS